jgi:N-acyl-D-amino-acid deacylase
MPTAATLHPDLIIRSALLLDGSGAPGTLGDLAVGDDRIVALGDLGTLKGGVEIDGAGKALAPGFIDVHTHDDRALLSDPLMACKASQGVTTVIAGNCGINLAPLTIDRRPPPPLDLVGEKPEHYFASFRTYLDALDAAPPAINAACQVGHSTLRLGAMDSLDRPASAAEIVTMRRRLEQSLEAGAIGLSSGLWYEPAAAAPTAELIELAKALKPLGAIHTTHMRDEADHVLDSLEESFEIGRKAGVPVVISHHKVTGTANHGRTRETLQVIEKARKGQSVGLDVYPYVAGSTVLRANRLDRTTRVLVTWSRARPEFAGQDLDAIARQMGCDMFEAIERLQPAGAIYFMMDEADVRRVLSYPYAMIGSDGLPHDEHPHPRLWGTFPRVLGHYARDIGLFTLAEAVRRMTSLPAAKFGLTGRGVLRPGAVADLVLFDPATVGDLATFEKPKTPAAGIETVWVNGRAVWHAGQSTGARPGRALRLARLGPMGGETPPH